LQDCIVANQELYAARHSSIVVFLCHVALGTCFDVGTGARDLATMNSPGMVWPSETSPPVIDGVWWWEARLCCLLLPPCPPADWLCTPPYPLRPRAVGGLAFALVCLPSFPSPSHACVTHTPLF
jgi:hypothetical protein